MELTEEMVIVVEDLNFLTKTYDGINRMIVSTRNRIHHLNPDSKSNMDWLIGGEEEAKKKIPGLLSIKGRVSRQINKLLKMFDIWNYWMKDIPGVGPWIAAALIKEYYFKFVPICKKCGADLPIEGEGKFTCVECGTESKGQGIIKSRIVLKDFAKISAWWKYCGMHVVDGKKAKPKAGKAEGGRRGRAICYQLGESFVKQSSDHPYKAFYERAKAKRERTHPDTSKIHRHKMAMSETAKLFLSHFWQVARTMDGLPVTPPYSQTHLGHDNILEPFYWEPEKYGFETMIPVKSVAVM